MKAKGSHSETQETRFDYDCSPLSHLKFVSLFSCIRPPSSISSKIWNSIYQTTPSEGYSFIKTMCWVSKYCLLTLDCSTLFMCSQINLLKFNIIEVKRNITFPTLTNQCDFL